MKLGPDKEEIVSMNSKYFLDWIFAANANLLKLGIDLSILISGTRDIKSKFQILIWNAAVVLKFNL